MVIAIEGKLKVVPILKSFSFKKNQFTKNYFLRELNIKFYYD
jgi:hypothetical protein